MNDLYMNAKQQYQGILDCCRKQGWTVMSNDDQCMLSIHFKMDDLTEEVSIKVHEDKKVTVFNTMLPVICRRENENAMRCHLQELNEKEASSYGYFQLDERRIVYVYAYTFDGETRFNEKAFRTYMDACRMMPYLNAEGIIDIATEHLNIHEPDMSWLDWEDKYFSRSEAVDLEKLNETLGTVGERRIPDEW